ncbi:elongation factor 1-a [Mycena olivaceomarginata]|nr:elongation factor 1-a [Mycena olivaceomarginata]
MTSWRRRRPSSLGIGAPGHPEFIKNMITGTSLADCAILVVSAVPSQDGQTREHALLAFTFGIHQLVVAINKMDNIEWNGGRFNFQHALVRGVDQRDQGRRREGYDPAINAIAPPDVYRIGGIGRVIVGRIETGVIQAGMIVRFAPTSMTDQLQSVEMHHEWSGEALRISSIFEDPVKTTASFWATAIVLPHPTQITTG